MKSWKVRKICKNKKQIWSEENRKKIIEAKLEIESNEIQAWTKKKRKSIKPKIELKCSVKFINFTQNQYHNKAHTQMTNNKIYYEHHDHVGSYSSFMPSFLEARIQ